MLGGYAPNLVWRVYYGKKANWAKRVQQKWGKFSFGSIKLKKLALLQDVEALDVIKESRGLLPAKFRQEQTLLAALEDILKKEEIY